MGNSFFKFYFLYTVDIAGTNFLPLGWKNRERGERKTAGEKLQKRLYYCCGSLLQLSGSKFGMTEQSA